jgi:hypothetical protein
MNKNICEDGHAFFLRAAYYNLTPPHFLWECDLCGEKYETEDENFRHNQPVHPECLNEKHYWICKGCGAPSCIPIHFCCARCLKPCTKEEYDSHSR